MLDPSGNTVTFDIAEITSNCDKPGCSNKLIAENFTDGLIDFTCIDGYNCPKKLQITTTTTSSFSVTYTTFGLYTSDCGSGGGPPVETITIKLTYNTGP